MLSLSMLNKTFAYATIKLGRTFAMKSSNKIKMIERQSFTKSKKNPELKKEVRKYFEDPEFKKPTDLTLTPGNVLKKLDLKFEQFFYQ